jgi:solute carrier family 25 (mitochondrial carnitine/acylcarnitine transporter), member 20/29
MKKIYSAHGVAGIYKGQGVTLLREATGYGVYFLAYEKLMQREMAQKGIKREEISAAHAVLYGATAGYAVCRSHIVLRPLIADASVSFLYCSSGRSYIQ